MHGIGVLLSSFAIGVLAVSLGASQSNGSLKVTSFPSRGPRSSLTAQTQGK
jgi:hypothetical protein